MSHSLNTSFFAKIVMALAVIVMLLIILATQTNQLGIQTIPLSELKAKYTDEESEFISINGLDVHVKDEGDGPVIVMLHGILSSLHTWDGWADELKKDYRVVRMDLPYFGLTGAPDTEQFDDQFVLDTVVKVLEKKGVEKATFIGNSFGGWVSWRLAVDEPELVERVILSDAKSFPQDWPWPLQFVVVPPVPNLAEYITPRFAVNIGIHMVYGDTDKITSETLDAYHELILREGNRRAMMQVFQYFFSQGGRDSQPEDGIFDVQQPLMTQWGSKDGWVPMYVAEQWHKHYPSARHVVIENAGHVPMEEVPEKSISSVKDFLCDTDSELGYQCENSIMAADGEQEIFSRSQSQIQ